MDCAGLWRWQLRCSRTKAHAEQWMQREVSVRRVYWKHRNDAHSCSSLSAPSPLLAGHKLREQRFVSCVAFYTTPLCMRVHPIEQCAVYCLSTDCWPPARKALRMWTISRNSWTKKNGLKNSRCYCAHKEYVASCYGSLRTSATCARPAKHCLWPPIVLLQRLSNSFKMMCCITAQWELALTCVRHGACTCDCVF